MDRTDKSKIVNFTNLKNSSNEISPSPSESILCIILLISRLLISICKALNTSFSSEKDNFPEQSLNNQNIRFQFKTNIPTEMNLSYRSKISNASLYSLYWLLVIFSILSVVKSSKFADYIISSPVRQ